MQKQNFFETISLIIMIKNGILKIRVGHVTNYKIYCRRFDNTILYNIVIFQVQSYIETFLQCLYRDDVYTIKHSQYVELYYIIVSRYCLKQTTVQGLGVAVGYNIIIFAQRAEFIISILNSDATTTKTAETLIGREGWQRKHGG